MIALVAWLVGYSPPTWGFQLRSPAVVGISRSNGEMAGRASIGDVVFAYVAGAMKISGQFEITGPMFRDASPLYFDGGRDRYDTRFPTTPIFAFPAEIGLDLREIAPLLELFQPYLESRNLGAALRNLPTQLSSHDERVLGTRLAKLQGAPS